MRVLSPWFQGTPPKTGLWLVRIPHDLSGYGELLRWDGKNWRTPIGTRVTFGYNTCYQYRGLAFDPEAATYCYGYTGGADAWIVTEPKP